MVLLTRIRARSTPTISPATSPKPPTRPARAAPPLLAGLRRALPRGRTLPYDAWRRRHRLLVGLLAVHGVALFIYALLQGHSWAIGLAAMGVPLLLALVAIRCPGRRLPAAIVSVGLLACAAMAVHLSDGVGPANLDFFVVVVFLSLYEDWVPFLIALVCVLLHHAVLDGLDPGLVFQSAYAKSHHWGVALIQTGFLVAAGAGLMALWRFNEDVRHRLRALVDGSGDAIVEIDRKGEVVGWNAAAQAMLGYSSEEIECRPASVLAARGRKEELDHIVHSALHGEPLQRHEMDWARKGGRKVEVALTVSAIQDAGRPVGASIIVHDMAERLALQEAEQRFQDLVERVPAITYVAEPGEDGQWRYVSPQIKVMLGYSPEEWLADPLLWANRVHPDDRERVLEEEARFTSTHDPLACEYRMIARDGTVVWVRDDAVFRTRRPGRPEIMDGILTDITELKVMEGQLRHLANHDQMTGLTNRHRFEEELGRAVAYTQRYGTPGALLMLDLDGIKKVNDELGHHAGDALLKLVAAGLRDRLRTVDSVGRLGGDEFGVFLPGVDEIGAAAVAEDLVERIRLTRVEVEGRSVGTTASVGITMLRDHDEAGTERLMMQADSAMYEAKHAGGNRVALFKASGGARQAFA
jgi:diguanylate cyclase (GGDEF)-like protein/PAS domain S-box-containing protein